MPDFLKQPTKRNERKLTLPKNFGYAEKVFAIQDVLRKYFENDPWTGMPDPDYDDMLTPQDAIDEIVEILKK